MAAIDTLPEDGAINGSRKCEILSPPGVTNVSQDLLRRNTPVFTTCRPEGSPKEEGQGGRWGGAPEESPNGQKLWWPRHPTVGCSSKNLEDEEEEEKVGGRGRGVKLRLISWRYSILPLLWFKWPVSFFVTSWFESKLQSWRWHDNFKTIEKRTTPNSSDGFNDSLQRWKWRCP